MREVPHHHRFTPGPREGLLAKLGDAVDTGTGDRLEARGDHAREPSGVVQRLERHHGHDRRAVRARQDAAVPSRRVGIDLGDHERHVRVHPERRGVVDAQDTGCRGVRDDVASHAAARGQQRHVEPAILGLGFFSGRRSAATPDVRRSKISFDHRPGSSGDPKKGAPPW